MPKSKYAEKPGAINDRATTWGMIAHQVPQNATVLDVGCSTGLLGRDLIDVRDAKVTGIEMHGPDVAIARTRGLKPVLEANIEQFDWSELGDQTFDVIVFADLLEHLLDPVAVLRQAREYLAPDGKVVVSIPNIAHASIRVELMEGNFIYEPLGILDNTHTKYFTRESFSALLEQAELYPFSIEASIFDFPEGLLERRLAKVGLTPTDAFSDLLLTEEARAVQWVFAARTVPPKDEISRFELPQKTIPEFDALHKRAEDQHAYIQHQKREIQDLTDEIGRLRKRHSLAGRARRVAGRVKRSRIFGSRA